MQDLRNQYTVNLPILQAITFYVFLHSGYLHLENLFYTFFKCFALFVAV